MSKIVSLKRNMKDSLFIIKYAFKNYPIYYLFFITVKTAINVAYSLISVFIIKYVLDAIRLKLGFEEILKVLIILGIVYLVLQVMDSSLDLFNEIKTTRVKCRVQKTLIEKAAKVDLICYDEPDFYSEFVKAIRQSDEKISQSINAITTLITNSISIFVLGGVVVYVDPVIAIFPILSFLTSLITQTKLNRINYEYDMELYYLERKRDYSKRVFYQPEYAKEIRLTNIREPLMKQFSKTIFEFQETAKKYGPKVAFWKVLNMFFSVTFITYFCQPLYLCWGSIVLKTLTIGDFVAMTNASNIIGKKLNLVNRAISDFQKIGLYARHFRSFLEIEETIESNHGGMGISNKNSDLIIKNLSFKYKSMNTKVIDNINMVIKAKEKIAIVGHNGAGKSTFIKLILGLYEPSEGEILFDGVNLREYSIKDYREMFGVVFQEHPIFSATLSENICMDDPDLFKKQKIEDAIKNSELEESVKKLDKGIDTMLTREFDKSGVFLSGGETQKLAIARMLMKDFSIAVLDEPSSELDPIAEYNLNKSLIEIAKDSTIIFISHRLSTTRMVDKIYLFDKGKIIENGNHEELMKLNGVYADMFRKQACYYRT